MADSRDEALSPVNNRRSVERSVVGTPPLESPQDPGSLRADGETVSRPAGSRDRPADSETMSHPVGGRDRPKVDLAFLAPAQQRDSLGRLGHYEVFEVLGRGGFGIVFRAHDEVLQRPVAVKVLDPELAATPLARKRFLREARAAARVRHENVIQIYAVEEEPLPYLVMELIPGETLQQRLGRVGPLAVPQVLWIGRQIAAGLDAAHVAALIHRDVKPSNVLIEPGPPEKVKLTDFGLARAADDARLTESGAIAGTPPYMAPEQACGDEADHRADLFSLGSVLYAMVTGRPPFQAGTALAVLKQVAQERPQPIREIIPQTPGWLVKLIAALHAKDPNARPQTAREVADLLARHQAAVPDGAGPLSDERPAVTANNRRLRGVLMLGVIALAFLLGAVLVYLAHQRGYGSGAPGSGAPGSAAPEPKAPAGGKSETGNPAPDLSQISPVIDDDFSDPMRSVLNPFNDGDSETKFADGRFVQRQLWGPSRKIDWWHCYSWQTRYASEDFACQATGRVVAPGDAGWAVLLFAEPRERALAVRVRADAKLEVGNAIWNVKDPPYLITGLLAHPAVRPGGEENTVLVVLRGGRSLQVHVNGSAVSTPIRLRQPTGRVFQGLMTWRRGPIGDEEVRAEFSRLTVWQLPPAEPDGPDGETKEAGDKRH
jgi:serine/threonine protein kinase